MPVQVNPLMRVLVMDDEHYVRTCTTMLLEELGYLVVTACNGTEAVQLLAKATDERYPFHAAILDLNVPGDVGAVEILPLIRQIDPDLRLILTSGNHHSPEMLQPREYGFYEKLPKPYGIAELRKIMAGLRTQSDEVKSD